MDKYEVRAFIGDRILQLRKAKGLRQEDLAVALNITRTSIINIEVGRQRLIIDYVPIICGLLECTPNDLFPPIEKIDYAYEEEEIEVVKKVTVKKLKLNNPATNEQD
jgi:transcriptional regulator with XRE-family HTH domain